MSHRILIVDDEAGLSARDESSFVRQAWDHDVDLFLTKPVSRNQLTSLIERVLADKEEEPYRLGAA